MKGTCIMGTPDDIQILFGKIDSLVKVTGDTNLSIEGLRGDIRVVTTQMEHKAERMDITKDISLHAIECATRASRGSKGSIWEGMTAGQKTALLAAVIMTIGSVILNILQNT